MFKLILTILVSLVVGTDHYGGLAVSVNQEVINSSKSVIMTYLKRALKTLKLDDMTINILGDENFTNMYFTAVDIEEQDVDITIQKDRIRVAVHRAGGRITGHSRK